MKPKPFETEILRDSMQESYVTRARFMLARDIH